jgi:hypothetical protein
MTAANASYGLAKHAGEAPQPFEHGGELFSAQDLDPFLLDLLHHLARDAIDLAAAYRPSNQRRPSMRRKICTPWLPGVAR